MLTSIGPYSLDACISGLSGLSELSPLEYEILPKMFPGEKIYTAPGVRFLSHEWTVKVGVIGDRIYKLAAQLFWPGAGGGEEIFLQVLGFCEREMGKPTDHVGKQSIGSIGQYNSTFVWNTTLGNVTLVQGEGAGRNFVTLILTSGDKSIPSH